MSNWSRSLRIDNTAGYKQHSQLPTIAFTAEHCSTIVISSKETKYKHFEIIRMKNRTDFSILSLVTTSKNNDGDSDSPTKPKDTVTLLIPYPRRGEFGFITILQQKHHACFHYASSVILSCFFLINICNMQRRTKRQILSIGVHVLQR